MFTAVGRLLRIRQVHGAMDLPAAPDGIDNPRLELKRLAGRGIPAETEPGLPIQPRP